MTLIWPRASRERSKLIFPDGLIEQDGGVDQKRRAGLMDDAAEHDHRPEWRELSTSKPCTSGRLSPKSGRDFRVRLDR